MKKFIESEVVAIKNLSETVFEFEVKVGDVVSQCKSGQFCSIYINSNSNILPRPISISQINIKEQTLTFVVAVVGEGTKLMSNLKVGESVSMITPIGNGFNLIEDKKVVYLIGGGIGIPPLVQLYKDIKSKNDFNVTVVLGYRDENTFLIDKFEKDDLIICTDDGSAGFKGNVVQYLESEKTKIDYIYSCGPTPMLKGLVNFADCNDIHIQISMEERMACSVGACLGCVIKVKSENDFEYKKVCVEGPVFNGKEVIFE